MEPLTRPDDSRSWRGCFRRIEMPVRTSSAVRAVGPEGGSRHRQIVPQPATSAAKVVLTLARQR